MTLVTSFCHHRNGLRLWVPVEHSKGHLLRIRKTLHATNIPYVFSLVGYIPFRSGQTGTKNSGSQLIVLNRRSCERASCGKIAWKKLRADRKIFFKYEICLPLKLHHFFRVLDFSRLQVWYYTIICDTKKKSFLQKLNYDLTLALPFTL